MDHVFRPFRAAFTVLVLEPDQRSWTWDKAAPWQPYVPAPASAGRFGHIAAAPPMVLDLGLTRSLTGDGLAAIIAQMCAPRNGWPLILASTSPRRRQLLSLLGLPFEVRPADINESSQEQESPAAMVARLSEAKARAVLMRADHGFIVAADTLVYLDGAVLGKPSDATQAVLMLERLRGRRHVVFSGVTVLAASSSLERTAVAQSTVWMRRYSNAEVRAYVASGDPLDKAGAYAFQNTSFAPASRVEGCYLSVMGLPLCHLYLLLRELGGALSQTPVAACNDFTRRVCAVAATVLSHPTTVDGVSVER